MARRAGRVDANQRDIVDALRKAGALVAITSQLGDGFPDIVVGLRGQVYLVEIKDGSKSPSAQALTEPEKAFHQKWKGHVHVVNSIASALTVVGLSEVQR